MPKVNIMVTGFRCERCDHEWIPRNGNRQPKVCPKCKSPYWDRPRKHDLKRKKEMKDEAKKN